MERFQRLSFREVSNWAEPQAAAPPQGPKAPSRRPRIIRNTLLALWLLPAASACIARAAEPPPNTGARARALLLGGGSAEEAERWSKRWSRSARTLGEVLVPAEGFPRVVAPGEIAGEATHQLVLGTCTAEEAPGRLEILQALYPQARAVAASVAGSCPSMPTGARVKAVRTVKASEGTRLTGILYLRQPRPEEWAGVRKSPADPEAGVWRAEARLFRGDDPAGVEVKEYSSIRDAVSGASRCVVELEAEANQLVLLAKCEEEVFDPRCNSGGIARLTESTRFSSRAGLLKASTTVLENVRPPACPSFKD